MFCTNCGKTVIGNSKFCTQCGKKFDQLLKNDKADKSKRSTTFKKKLYALVVLFIVIVVYLFFIPSKDNINVAASVVNIYCEGETEEDSSGGSGTMFSEDGLILTNAHIIPESARYVSSPESAPCIVILPDPNTGASSEIYYAYPIFDKNFSDEYDLAFLQIHDVYYSSEDGVAHGEYPKKFPFYSGKKRCGTENVKLGEPITVYGYPSITGGNALTVTNGIVSSFFVDEGLIITSAKVSHGNSGGLAVDQNGCMIGVPSKVISDEYENLGAIISNDRLNEYIDKIQ